MTLPPGLPPARRGALPVPPGGAAAARSAGVRRRLRGAAAGAAVVAVAVGASALNGPSPREGLEVAARPPGVGPGVVAGRVTDPQGRPLARVAVLPTDLSLVLTRTGPDGSFRAPCGGDLLLAAYAPSARGAAVRERSPGPVDVAWRRLPTAGRCGERLEVVLPPGGAVEGTGAPGSDVLLQRARGTSAEVLPLGPVFATRVPPDGGWRVEGLDTGRYLTADGTAVDVVQGRTARLP